jgi:predicted P-loop ATPase
MSFPFTRFGDLYGYSLTTEPWEIEDLERLARDTIAPVGDQLPLGKLAEFGAKPSPADANGKGGGSLRWDGNVAAVWGIELDHDDGTMLFDEAVARLEAEGLVFLAHTTKRHVPHHPRWRGWLPFSKAHAPAQRRRMVNRANGLLGGALAKESWTLSQGFFIGRVDGVDFEIAVGTGSKHIDEADNLDASAMPFHAPGQTPPTGKKGKPDYGALTDDVLKDLIIAGAHRFGPGNELLRRWAYQEAALDDAETELRAVFDKVPVQGRTRGWHKDYGSVRRWAEDAYSWVGKRKGSFLAKLVLVVQEDPRWRGALRYNDFTKRAEVATPFPPQPGQVLDTWRPLEDPGDIFEALLEIQGSGFPNAGMVGVRQVLNGVARRIRFHPVRHWFENLPSWDQTHRVNQFFIDYVPGSRPDDPDRCDKVVAYYEKTAECFMVGAVARIFEPGCKVDTLPVVIGPQSYLKSQGVAALVPDPAWFSDDVSTVLIDRDTKHSLVGKWIIELAEFPHIKKEVEKVKAFFSRQFDRFRAAYGHNPDDWGRQCVFVATANELEFIDATGNRRTWPIPIDRPVDAAAIIRDREQLWAEALYLYRNDYKWWLPPRIEVIAAEIQGDYLEEDPLDGPVQEWVDRHHPDLPDPSDPQKKQCTPFSASAVLVGLGYTLKPDVTSSLGYHLPKPIASRADRIRVVNALKRAGYVLDKHPRTHNGQRQRCWQRP